MISEEKSLKPLAQCIFAQDDRDPVAEAAAFVASEKGVDSVEDAFAGGAGHHCRMGKRRSVCPHANDDVVKVQQKVTATVLDVGLKRRRISLSLKSKEKHKNKMK